MDQAIQKWIDEKVASLDPKLSDLDRERTKELLTKVLGEGVPVQEAMHLSDNAVEYIYSDAYQKFETGKYEDASNYFMLLYIIKASDPRFSFGLGACAHKLKNYEKAIQWYFVSGVLDPENPLPFYYASDCYINSNELDLAEISLIMSLNRIGSNEKHATLKERVKMMINALRAQKQVENEEKLPVNKG